MLNALIFKSHEQNINKHFICVQMKHIGFFIIGFRKIVTWLQTPLTRNKGLLLVTQLDTQQCLDTRSL